jgi:anthranilate phosphoribosyltransferase
MREVAPCAADVLAALVRRDGPVPLDAWRSFWNRLHEGGLRRGEAAALLASLSTRPPDEASARAFVSSLAERRVPPRVPALGAGTVNIVGTGGGPRTVNISTAAAFVAATLGVRVVKSGSRGYSSLVGSIDLLDRLGVPVTRSYAETEEMVDRFGIACAGGFVYPAEIGLLARSVFPLDWRMLGRFVNVLGPFLAATPTSAQITGVSDLTLLPFLRGLASADRSRCVWICSNALGVDELLGFVDNVVYRSDSQRELRVRMREFGVAGRTLGNGSLADLRPPADSASAAAQFRRLLAGAASPGLTGTVALNAAAMVIAAGGGGDWAAAVRSAAESIAQARPAALLDRIRRDTGRRSDPMAAMAAAGHRG